MIINFFGEPSNHVVYRTSITFPNTRIYLGIWRHSNADQEMLNKYRYDKAISLPS